MTNWLPTCCLWCQSVTNLLEKWQLCYQCHKELFVETYYPNEQIPLRCNSFTAPFLFTGKLREMILNWKYQATMELTRPLSAAAISAWGLQDFTIDSIIPVPPHRSRLQERTIHQTLLLAKEISKWSGAKLFHGLQRSKATPSQTALTRREREVNLKGVFTLTKADRLTNKRILVIDDVVTSGATLRAVLRILREANPAEIHVRALARQPFSKERDVHSTHHALTNA